MFGKKDVELIAAGGMNAVGEKNGLIVKYGDDATVIDWGQKIPEVGLPDDIRDNLPEEYYPDAELLRGLNVVALCVTHAHMDHSEGWHKVHALFPEAPLITDDLTSQAMRMRAIKGKRTSFPRVMSGEVIQKRPFLITRIEIGPFLITRFEVNHSVDASGFLVEVGGRKILHFGDSKLWPSYMPDKIEGLSRWLGSLGEVDVFLPDSTNAEKSGFVKSENTVANALEDILQKEHGRVFVTAISSNHRRLQRVLWIAEQMHRTVFVGGKSMQDFLHIAGVAGWHKITKKFDQRRGGGFYLLPNPMSWPHGSIVLATGSQGEPDSFLDDTANEMFKLPPRAGDVFVLAQTGIPVPELLEQRSSMLSAFSGRVERIYYPDSEAPVSRSRGAEFIHDPNTHTSGHENIGGVMRLLGWIEARTVIPCHGDRFKREIVAEHVRDRGGEAVLLDDGETFVV